MNKRYYILIWFCLLLISTQAFSSMNDNVFLINRAMRCESATNYLVKYKNTDTIAYKLVLKNAQADVQQILLEIPIQQIDKIKVQQLDANNILKKQYAFVSKKISYRIYYDRNIVFPIDLAANATNTIVFKFHKNDIHNYFKPEILIWKKDAKIARTEALELTRGMFYGILILYSFICFLLAYLLNIRNYYYYLFYLISGIVYLFVKNNLGYELLWPDYPSIDIFFKKIMLSIYLITSILFLRGFIKPRINLRMLQVILRYFIYFGLLLIIVSLLVGLPSLSAQRIFITIQNIFAIASIATIVITFIFVYIVAVERSIVLFALLYFISFSFFLFYPQPEFGRDFFGVYIGQIYTYSNAFIIATIICIYAVYRVLKIIRNNEQLKKEMSLINSKNNFSLIEGQQNERTRVGRELHDGIGIMMSAIKMKISAIHPNNKAAETALKNIVKQIDGICSNIRLYSHTLLPPTLKKFGIQVALKDMLEDFKQQHNVVLSYNFNIPENLSEVSQQLIYDFLKNFIHYFSVHKPEQLTISIYVISSIKEIQIRIQHTGSNMDINHDDIKTIISIVNLLNGKFQVTLLNAWNSKLRMEFPVLLSEKIVKLQ